jgi:tetratricopeptide (TPR) repeat protein
MKDVLVKIRVLLPVALVFSGLGVGGLGAASRPGQSQPSGSSGESEVAAHFRAGKEAMSAGQAERAIQEYQAVLRLMPNLAEAHANLGMAYYDAGEYLQASRELAEAQREKPELMGANLYLGMAYLKLGSPARAIPPLAAVLRQDSANQDALHALGTCYLAEDDYRRAADVFLKLSAAHADPAERYYSLGRNYLGMIKQLSLEISKKLPGTAWAERFAGDQLADRGRWADAAARYSRALALDATVPGLHAALGDMLLRQGKPDKAEAEYRAELQRDANSEEALLGMAAVDLAHKSASLALENVVRIWEIFPPFLARQADFPLVRIDPPAITVLEPDVASAPDSPAREFLLAGICRAGGQSERAAAQWSAFLQRVETWSADQPKEGSQPESGGAPCETHRYAECVTRLHALKATSPGQKILLGRALLTLGNSQAAAAAFAEALDQDQRSVPTRYWLMRSYERLAVASFDRMAEIDPDSWRLHQMHGEYYQFQLNYQKAIEAFQTALKSSPGSAELHEQLGDAYLFDKNEADGEAEIREALRLDPTRAGSLYLLGRIYFARRDITKSMECFRGAVRYDPGFLQAHADLGRAYMRAGDAASAEPELERAAATDDNGDLHYRLYLAYRKLGKNAMAAQALAASQELRKKYAARGEAAVGAAEDELSSH